MGKNVELVIGNGRLHRQYTKYVTLEETLVEAVSVTDCGGVGDGVTDDTVAIQTAVDTYRHVYLPAGTYRVTSPIIINHLASGGLTMEGTGWGLSGFAGTTIVGDTGKHVFECIGSQFLAFRNFSVTCGTTSPSTCGFLFARSTKAGYGYAQFNSLQNIHVNMGSDDTANGGHGTIAVCNIAAELMNLHNVYLWGVTALGLMQNNTWGLVPVGEEAGILEGYSMSMVNVTGSSGFHTSHVSGYAIYAANAWQCEFTDIYFNGVTGASAMYLLGCNNWYVTALSDASGNLATIGNGCADVRIAVKGGSVSNSPYIADAGFVGVSRLHLAHYPNAAFTGTYFFECDAADALYDCTLEASYAPPRWTGTANQTDCEFIGYAGLTGGIHVHTGRAASPTAELAYRGQVVWYNAPAAGASPGWVCVSRVDTTLNGGEPSGETDMLVVSGLGIADGDIIGVKQDSGTIHWTTVASGGGTTTLVLTAGLTGAAANGKPVYTHRWAAMADLV